MVVLFEQKVWYLYGRECIRVVGFVLGRESMVERKQDMKKIMECRLNLKDKNLTMGEIYVCHCMNLLDHYSYMLLTNIY